MKIQNCLWGILFFSFFACQKTDVEKEKQVIQSIMDGVAQAHFEQNAQKFYLPNAEQWIDVRKGGVSLREKVLVLSGTQSYLDNMEFLELKNSH